MNQTKKRLKKIWPDLKLIWPTDPIFYKPTLEEITAVVNRHDPSYQNFVKNFNACEEHALRFLLETRQYRPPDGSDMNWGVGFVFGLKSKVTAHLSDPRHHFNICNTKTGIYLIDRPSQQIWEPTNEDKVVALLM